MQRTRVIALVGVLLSTALGAQENPLLERGFDPGKVYQFGDVDQVDLQGGALSLAIPIGQRFPVSDRFGYGFTLIYTSRVWDFVPGSQANTRRSVPNRYSNAGMSWRLTLGELYAPTDPLNPTRDKPNPAWAYVGQDGNVHEFWNRLHRNDTEDNGDSGSSQRVLYSRDNSYLRFKRPVSGDYTIEFPDGTVHSFELIPGSTTAYRLKEMRDRFGTASDWKNWVRVAYSSPTPTSRRWTITDSRGRQHLVNLDARFYDPPGTEANAFMVSSVQLAAYDDPDVTTDGTATYYFRYFGDAGEPADASLFRDCTDTDSQSGNFQAARLSSIYLPDATSGTGDNLYWRFTYHNESSNESCVRGQLASVRYPTGGFHRYVYSKILLPTEEPCPQPFDAITSTTIGLWQRIIDENGTLEPSDGRWYYSYDLSDFPAGHTSPCESDPQSPVIWPTEQQTTTVTSPAGDVSEHYFSVWSDLDPSPNNFLRVEFGMPFTRLAPVQTDGTFLSTRTFDCPGSGCMLQPEVETWVRFAVDDLPTNPPAQVSTAIQVNRRTDRVKTKFFEKDPADPTGARIETSRTQTFTSFDGVGHYRNTEVTGSFPGHGFSPKRTQRIDYNPARGTYPGSYVTFPSSDNWILETYESSQVEEDQDGNGTVENEEISRTEFEFDTATGFLSCRRQVKTGATLGNHDVTARFVPDEFGNVTLEQYRGGDLQTIVVDPLCPVGAPPEYQIDHEISYAPVPWTRKTRYLGLTSSFYTADEVLDRNTGKVTLSRDSSLIPTAFKYDPMGRLVEVRPGSGLGLASDAWTRIEYNPTLPRVVGIDRCVVGTTDCDANNGANKITQEYVELDGLGRVLYEGRKLPNLANGNAGGWNFRYTKHDDMDHVTKVSSWVLESDYWPGNIENMPFTVYSDIDPFGRAWTVTAPDGKVTNLFFMGERWRGTTQQIAQALNGTESPAQRWEGYDLHGRLVRVEELSRPAPNQANDVVTEYRYDEGNRLRHVCGDASYSGNPATQSCVQNRWFSYDGRGFLTSEQHPEKGGLNGNGLVSYSSYNSRGHARYRDDGGTARRLDFTFDAAERVSAIRDSAGNILKSYTYDTAPGAGLGKLQQALRKNFAALGGELSIETDVVESYEYSGRSGRPSRRTTKLVESSKERETWTIDQAYDSLGNVESIGYPNCTGGVCDEGPPEELSMQTQSLTYQQGLLRTIPGWAPGIYYHPNLVTKQVVHSNGMVEDIAIESSTSMARPKSITATFPGGTWSTGLYAYDGAGNIKSMGSDQFRYDAASRLLEGNLASVSRSQTYRFDAFGNLDRISTAGEADLNIPVQGATTGAPINRIAGPAAYDQAGNLISWNGNTYNYDLFNNMSAVGISGGVTARYLFTADDERILAISSDGGTRTWTIRDFGNRVLTRETHQVGVTGWTRLGYEYIWRGDRLLGNRRIHLAGQQLSHFALDHLGTVRLTTQANGTEVNRDTFFPFGREATTVAGQEVMRFTGHERDLGVDSSDPADDLDYMHARTGNPLLGRFLSPDPVGGAPATPQSWNRYTYVLGNPTKYRDPDGKLAWLALLEVALSVVDVVQTVETVADPDASTEEKIGTAVLTAAGLVLPAGGATLSDDAVRAVGGLVDKAVDAIRRTHVADVPTRSTRRWSAWFRSEGEARALARERLGSNPVEVERFKWRSADGKWQYRAKPSDVADNHIHLEELDPKTGEVIQNLHLRWKEGTDR